MPDSIAVKTGRFYDDAPPGVVQVIHESFTAEVAVDAAGVIRMVPVTKGAKIVDVKIKFTGFGAGRTVSVGDGSNPDRFLSGGNVAAPGVLSCAAETGFFYEYTAKDTIDIAVLGGTMPVDAVIDIIVLYVMNQ